MKRKGSTTSIVIATIAGLSVLGVAGYRMMSGDCSSCAITGVEATATTVATQGTGDSCCPLTDGQKQAEATPVAAETNGRMCGSEKACGMETACTDKADQVEMVSTTAESCEIACSDKAACEGETAEVQMVSTTGQASDCGSACAGDACGKDADACCGKCDAGKELAKAPE